MQLLGCMGVLAAAGVAVWSFIDPTAFIVSAPWWICVVTTVGLWLIQRSLSNIISAAPQIIAVIAAIGVLIPILLSFILVGWQGGIAIILCQPLCMVIAGLITRVLFGVS